MNSIITTINNKIENWTDRFDQYLYKLADVIL